LVTVGGGSVVLTGIAGVIAPNEEAAGVVSEVIGAGELASGLAFKELVPSELLKLVVAGARQPTPSGAPVGAAPG
jgi:hypothetical protein